jgi:serine/threonine-protein kinase RsbW
MKATETFVISNRLQEIPLLAERIDAFAALHEIEPATIFQVNLVIDELLTNVISYGYPQNGDHQIEITLVLQEEQLVITIVDDGEAFNPILQAPEVELDATVEERKVGGLGLHFMRTMMDALDYRRQDGYNKLQLTKKL